MMVEVKTAFAIDAVERTEFAVAWQEVDAEGYAESATVDGTKYGGWECEGHRVIYNLLFGL